MESGCAVDGALLASGGGVSLPSGAADVGAVMSTSEKPVSRVISEQFSALSVGSKFTCGEKSLYVDHGTLRHADMHSLSIALNADLIVCYSFLRDLIH
jgi:hypothetical protein